LDLMKWIRLPCLRHEQVFVYASFANLTVTERTDSQEYRGAIVVASARSLCHKVRHPPG